MRRPVALVGGRSPLRDPRLPLLLQDLVGVVRQLLALDDRHDVIDRALRDGLEVGKVGIAALDDGKASRSRRNRIAPRPEGLSLRSIQGAVRI